jgi:hypothetical protein
MLKKICILIGLTAALSISSIAFSADDPAETMANGCKSELENYCKDVTPGEGRVLACLYAHNDKISAKCEYALYDSVIQLERALMAMAYVADECEDDLDEFCAEVPIGGGRLLDCIEKNKKKVSKSCLDAIEETGLNKK